MREILFRGRNKWWQWVVGDLSVSTDTPKRYYITERGEGKTPEEVDPRSIGQLAFPATKDHPDIWEGDIIEDKHIRRIVVSYDGTNCNARAFVETPYELERKLIDEFFFQDLFQKGKPEIVGTIHDLPPKRNRLQTKQTNKTEATNHQNTRSNERNFI